MRFCTLCDNMMYIALDHGAADGALEMAYECKHCGNVERDGEGQGEGEGEGEAAGAGTARVMFTNYSDDQAAYKQYVNQNIRHDPTLPRKSNIACPSAACTKPADAAHRVIYVKYDARNLRYLYCCEHCGAFWKSGDAAALPAPAPAPAPATATATGA